VGLELTTVTTTSATFHRSADARESYVWSDCQSGYAATVTVLDGLEPATAYEHEGISFTTLPRPAGRLRCRFATVNDVHFGETEAGHITGTDLGPVLRAEPGIVPYPLLMNEAAVGEIEACAPAGVFVKGDLTGAGAPDEFAAFSRCYGRFGDRLHVVRGNHDAYDGAVDFAGDRWVELDGVAVAMLDTARAGRAGGELSPAQLDWLDDHTAAATSPVVVMGHHPQSAFWFDPAFVLDRASSDRLDEIFARRASIVTYAAGHTHRTWRGEAGGGVPSIEVACVKDFPGVWAEYEVYDGGLLQIVHRISDPAALAWSERCRGLYAELGVDYTEYALGRLEHRCFAIPLR